VVEISSEADIPAPPRKKKVCGVASFSIWNYLTDCESGTKHRKSTAITTDSDGIDDDGIPEDIVVTTTSTSSASHHEDKTCDVNAFFNEAQLFTLQDGSAKCYCICKNCLLVS
jgi:hypothetical protein